MDKIPDADNYAVLSKSLDDEGDYVIVATGNNIPEVIAQLIADFPNPEKVFDDVKKYLTKYSGCDTI
jgi:hypothetical protein